MKSREEIEEAEKALQEEIRQLKARVEANKGRVSDEPTTQAQEWLYKYILLSKTPHDSVLFLGDLDIEITRGKDRAKLSVNLYGDILKEGQVIARSDLEHSLNGAIRAPKSWETLHDVWEEKKNVGGRPNRERPAHRFSLQLEDDLRPYLEYISNKQGKSPTKWINDTIRQKQTEFFENGGQLPPSSIDDIDLDD